MMQDKSVSGTRRTYAVITGATSGLGRAYAKWFGGKGYDLIITGRRKDIIEKRAEEIREAYGCSVEVVLTDLAEEQGTANLLARMDGKPVDVLVNNAGFGLGLEFADSDIKDIRRLIFLQTSAIAELTHYVLRDMKKKHHGTIINISSDGAFAPLPKNVTYAASKRFLVTFTEGLHMELAGTGVRVQVVCPGFIDSDFHEGAGMHVDKKKKGMFAFRHPETVVAGAMKDYEKGKVVSVPDLAGKLIKVLAGLLPQKVYYGLAGIFVKKFL